MWSYYRMLIHSLRLLSITVHTIGTEYSVPWPGGDAYHKDYYGKNCADN